MKTYKPHPAALAMPPMKKPELDELKRSILDRGQIHPAVLIEGKLLDGRNRQEALVQLLAEKKIAPSTELKVVEWSGRGRTAVGFVDATNDKRRHLNESQRAMIATRLLPFFRKEMKERQRQSAVDTNKRRKQPDLLKTVGATRPRSSEQAAKLAGGKVSSRTVKRAEFVRKTDPALAKKVFEGELTVNQAEKQIRHRAQVAQAKAYEWPVGEYPVIMVDPPWRYSDGLDGSDAVGGGTPYPTMSIGEIAVMPLPLSQDCAVFLWITNPMLIDPAAYGEIAREWGSRHGLRPVQVRTWVKTEADGAPFIGMGHVWRNDTEHLVRFERGRPAFNKVTQRTAFSAPVGRHSEKPAAAFDDVAALCAATKRIEMFARAPRDGWVTSGSELAPSADSGDSPRAQPVMPKLEEAPAAAGAPSFSQHGGLGTSSAAKTMAAELIDAVAGLARPGLRVVPDELPIAAPMFIDTPAGQAAVAALNEGTTKAPVGFAPPIDPESLKPVDDDQIPF